ncbi:MAG TPA: lipoyl(octanoyl) transferase LipB [Nitrososphaerales archaeon]|nr:lipoyl(octanoyl) transferase LipB [Nitrososphaerales archaeon]
MLKVFDVGRMPYGPAWDLQKRLVAERTLGSLKEDALILVEHDHVITLGRKTTSENLRPQDIPVFKVERGGDATYHGPGQLVGYPIVRLSTPNVQRFVRDLEEVLIQSARAFGVESARLEGHPGVWVGDRKLASIGVAVTNWVTMHGFALNVNTDLSYFKLIKPCGLDPNRMTSMQKIAGRPLEMQAVKEKVMAKFGEVFGVALERTSLAELNATVR